MRTERSCLCAVSAQLAAVDASLHVNGRFISPDTTNMNNDVTGANNKATFSLPPTHAHAHINHTKSHIGEQIYSPRNLGTPWPEYVRQYWRATHGTLVPS